jgi:hypothetical protein
VATDPRCLGAYLSLQEPSKPAGLDNPHLVMAVGNGDMWVTDTGSRIQPGDYLIASNVRGCAMKDDPARYPIGYIIARAAEPLDFSKLPPARRQLKQAKISVLFENFVRNSEAVRLAEIVESQQREIQTLKAQTEQAQTQLKALLGEVRQFKARIETDYDKAQAAGQGHDIPGS